MPKFQRRLHSTRSKTDDSEVPRTLPSFESNTAPVETKPAAAPAPPKPDEGKKESTTPESETKLALKLALKEKHMRKRKAFMDSLYLSFLSLLFLSLSTL